MSGWSKTFFGNDKVTQEIGVQFIPFVFCQTTLNGEPAEIFFSVMKTDERSALGENTVSLTLFRFSLFPFCHLRATFLSLV